MSDPIQFASNVSCWYPDVDGASAQENIEQLSSSALHGQEPEAAAQPVLPGPPPAGSSAAGSPPAASPPISGSQLLIARFTPGQEHPAAQPSLLKSIWACGPELANVVTTAVVAASAPETFGASLLGLSRIALVGNSFDRCMTRDEADQVKAQTNATASQECAAEGGVPLLSVDGSVVCAVNK